MYKNIKKWIGNTILILSAIIFIFAPIIIYIFSLKNKICFVNISFAEAYMSYFGTVFLGFVALYQNVKLNKENRKIRNVEKIQFLSFIKCSFDMEVPAETDIYGINTIIFEDNNRKNGLYINGKIKNISKYPITELYGEVYRNGKKVGKKTFYESYNFYVEPNEEINIILSIYILENSPDIVRTDSMPGFFYKFVYNEDKFAYLIDDNVNIILTFTNIFGNTTKGKISFTYNEPGGVEICTRFELEKIPLD